MEIKCYIIDTMFIYQSKIKIFIKKKNNVKKITCDENDM